MNLKILLLLGASLSVFACSKPQTSETANSAASAPVKLADLKVGDKAPEFTTKGALAGAEYSFSLADKLKEGPLVLYFFPKVFTPGCTAEAHEFAERTEDFKKLGANIIGMSGDDIEGLKKFSKEECRDKFAVAMASQEVIKAYGVALGPVADRSNRTSFVIGQDGIIKFIHSEMDFKGHVSGAYEAVKVLAKDK